MNKKLKPKLILIFWYDMFSKHKICTFSKFNTKFYDIVDMF